MHKDFSLFTTTNDKIAVTIYGYENLPKNPCIFYVHGFKGFKDWGFVPYTGEFLAAKGYAVITFNFSHNGIGSKKEEFTETDKFAENTFSLEVAELSEVIDAYLFGFFGETINSKIGIIGHSRGGAVSILASSKREEVTALTVWSSISHVDRYTDRQKTEWKEKGHIEVVNSRTNQVMKLNLKVLEDIEKNKEKKLNIEYAVKQFERPFLIVHGEQDLTVPVNEAIELFSWADPGKSEIQIIPAAGHTFNIVHPFEESNPRFDSVLTFTEEFFNNNFI
jgi:uncharacterized protein